MRIGIVNLKGGSGKTTTAIFMAAGLARFGPTLLVDADPQGSALSWVEQAETAPFAAVGLPSRDLPRRLEGLQASFDHLVIDTPPGDAAIIRSALLAVEEALVPMPPTLVDLDRLRPTLDVLEEARAANPKLAVKILLVRVRARTRSARTAREVLSELGLPVVRSEIPLREGLANAFGRLPSKDGFYEPVLGELLEVKA